MNRLTDSSSWKILSTSIESSGRRIPIEMESLCTSMPRCVNERCERLDIGRLLSAWGSFCLRVDDPRQHRQRSRPFHDDSRGDGGRHSWAALLLTLPLMSLRGRTSSHTKGATPGATRATGIESVKTPTMEDVFQRPATTPSCVVSG